MAISKAYVCVSRSPGACNWMATWAEASKGASWALGGAGSYGGWGESVGTPARCEDTQTRARAGPTLTRAPPHRGPAPDESNTP
eukprot:scaffold99087_cov63-Phaeocystis_antarctica.AAC.1